jgi:hypothetical protein
MLLPPVGGARTPENTSSRHTHPRAAWVHSQMLAWAVITSPQHSRLEQRVLPPIGQRIWKSRLAVQTSVDPSLVR